MRVFNIERKDSLKWNHCCSIVGLTVYRLSYANASLALHARTNDTIFACRHTRWSISCIQEPRKRALKKKTRGVIMWTVCLTDSRGAIRFETSTFFWRITLREETTSVAAVKTQYPFQLLTGLLLWISRPAREFILFSSSLSSIEEELWDSHSIWSWQDGWARSVDLKSSCRRTSLRYLHSLIDFNLLKAEISSCVIVVGPLFWTAMRSADLSRTIVAVLC